MSMAFILKKKICSMSSSSVLIGVLVVTGFVILYIRHVYVHLDDVPSQSSSSEGSIKHTTSRGGSDESWREMKSSEKEDLVVIYNRVPKTGSTSFMKIVYDLHKINQFSAVYVNVSGKTMNLATEASFVQNVTQWKSIRPVIYHGHFRHLNFARFGSSVSPVYINIIRDPLERLVSHYYFLRYGDNFRPYKIRQRMGDHTTFDECVKQDGKDCKPEQLWLQVPYFCGSNPRCSSPGNKWALEQAKRHLSDSYLLVGITEEMEKFIRILDHVLPRMFKGAIQMYLDRGGVHVRKTTKKQPVSKETQSHFKSNKIWQVENEFYQFARGIFRKQYNFLFNAKDGEITPKRNKVLYQKVKLIHH